MSRIYIYIYKKNITFCWWRFMTHTSAVVLGGGRGSDSSAEASRSEKGSCSLLGEGREESESPSLQKCVSSRVFFICSCLSSSEVCVSTDELLCSVSFLCWSSERLEIMWFLCRFLLFIICVVGTNTGQTSWRLSLCLIYLNLISSAFIN